MTRTLLDNTAWDFGTNCFVCEPTNEKGLGIPFYLEVEEQRVVADLTPQAHHSGAPMYAHGGLAMAVLDEGMNWAIIALARRFGLTRNINVDFRKPLRIGETYLVSCRVEGVEGNDCKATGEILDARGRPSVSAKASFYVMTREEADAALGAASAQAADYTR